MQKNNWLQKIMRSSLYQTFIEMLVPHQHAIIASWQKLQRSPIVLAITITVMGMALALPAGLFVMLHNIEKAGEDWQSSTQITAYLQMNIDEKERQNLQSQLNQREDVSQVEYISPEQGLLQFKKQSGFSAALALLEQNPLPPVFIIHPASSLTSAADIEHLEQALKKLPGVDAIQFDLGWVQRLFALINLGQHTVIAVSALLALAALFAVGLTIRLAMQKYRKEIKLMQLIGATAGYIRRPFLYIGVIYGLLGGLLAWTIVEFILWWLQPFVTRLTMLYGSDYSLAGLPFDTVFTLLATSTLLGLVGAWISVTYYIRELRF